MNERGRRPIAPGRGCDDCGERDARDLYRDRDGKVRCVDCGVERDRARERTGD